MCPKGVGTARVCVDVVAKVSKNDGEDAKIEGEMGVRCALTA